MGHKLVMETRGELLCTSSMSISEALREKTLRPLGWAGTSREGFGLYRVPRSTGADLSSLLCSVRLAAQ
jgi:hypothetical protein